MTARPSARKSAPATACPTLSWIPPGVPGSIETDKYGFDPDAAKQALADSSYGGPENLPEIKLSYQQRHFRARSEAVEWIAGQFRDILGIELELEPIDGTTLTAMRKDATTHPQLLYFGGWFQDYPTRRTGSASSGPATPRSLNRVGYCNEDFDALTKKGDTTVDQDERMTYYEQAGQVLVDDVPGPFLFNRHRQLRRQPERHRLHPDGQRGRVARAVLVADDARQDGVTE